MKQQIFNLFHWESFSPFWFFAAQFVQNCSIWLALPMLAMSWLTHHCCISWIWSCSWVFGKKTKKLKGVYCLRNLTFLFTKQRRKHKKFQALCIFVYNKDLKVSSHCSYFRMHWYVAFFIKDFRNNPNTCII